MIALLAIVLFCTPTPPRPQPPAPPPQPVSDYADLSLLYASGQLQVIAVHRGRFAQPTVLPRYLGRFVATVRKGARPLAESRFDLPLLAGTESEDATPEARKLAELLRKGVTARTTVRIGLPDGADEIVLRDSQSGRTITVPLLGPREAAPRGAPRAR